jgi:uncharacterized membrane protein
LRTLNLNFEASKTHRPIAARLGRFCAGLAVCIGALALSARDAHAQRRGFGPNPENAPSVFAYGFRGLGIGLPVGLSAAYLLTRDDEWGSEDWKHLGMGTAIGAVGGSVLGLGVGFYDLYDRRPGTGMVVLRDTWYGVLLGASVGLLVGTVYWIDSGDAENVLKGGAWGTVIGAPVGAIIGFIEGPTVRDLSSGPGTNLAVHLQPIGTRAALTEGPTTVSWVPTLSGQF